MKDPIEVLPPSGDRILIVLRMEELRDWISFTLLNDLPLNLGHGSAIETSGEWILQRVHHWSDSRSQFPDSTEHRLTEVI